jgi:DNA mismatch repair protein MutS
MIETATILNQATHNSFVILDEVGRGTSTYDGLAIAWAVVEQLHNVNMCRVLFATHYRELTMLQKELKNMQCKTLKVQEWNNEVIFYHKIIDGIADKSYGIHVASIAGVPKKVIQRANKLLKKFEEENDAENNMNMELASQLEFDSFNYDSLHEKIKSIDVDNISPRQALEILYELKREI